MFFWVIWSAILSSRTAFCHTPTPLSKCWMLSVYWLSHTFCWPERDLNRCCTLEGQVLCWIQNSELETNLQSPCSSHLSLFHMILTRPLKSGKGRRTHQLLPTQVPICCQRPAGSGFHGSWVWDTLAEPALPILSGPWGLCCPWGFLHLSHWNQKQRHHTVSGRQCMANSLLPLNPSFLPLFLNSFPETYTVIVLQGVPI